MDVEREAAAYDEAAVMANKQARLDAEKSRNMVGSGVMHEKSPAHSGCPGSMARSIFRRPAAASGEAVQASSYEQSAVECVQNTTDKTVNQQAGDIYNYERLCLCIVPREIHKGTCDSDRLSET